MSTMTLGKPLLLTVEQVAEQLNIGRTKVYELIRSGALPSVKIGGSRRIPTRAVNAYAEQAGAAL